MYRSTPSCHATRVVARSSRMAPLGAISPPQAAAGSACVRKSARVAAAAGTSLLTMGNLLFRRKRHLSDVDGQEKFPPSLRPCAQAQERQFPSPLVLVGEGQGGGSPVSARRLLSVRRR